MSYTTITRRIAAAALAAALSAGALMGLGAVAGHQADAPADETAATWSFVGGPIGKGGGSTNGATWS